MKEINLINELFGLPLEDLYIRAVYLDLESRQDLTGNAAQNYADAVKTAMDLAKKEITGQEEEVDLETELAHSPVRFIHERMQQDNGLGIRQEDPRVRFSPARPIWKEKVWGRTFSMVATIKACDPCQFGEN